MNALALAMLTLAQPAPSLPPIPREFRAAWIATVANIDWPSRRTLTTEQQKQELRSIFETARRLNLNALILQVRPVADSLYQSDLEPWSEFLTGTQGKAPDPFYDPLALAIELGKSHGIEVHAWFNPYRSRHGTSKSADAPNHINNTHPELVKTYGTFKWMDPGEPFVHERSLAVMLDVVRRYDLDGIHIDDYFYPYPVRSNGADVPFPDDPSWNRYVAAGGKLSRDDWRRDNVNRFIKRLYEGIKSEKPHVKFGISPFGIYRPGVPEGIRAGIDQYAQLYADALLWYREGWFDYFTPQLYWPIAQTPQAYPTLLNWWNSQNVTKRHLWPGNFTSRTNPKEGNWPSREVVDQIGLTRRSNATGNVHFSMRALTQNWNGIADALRSGPYAGPAFVPASPWLGNEAPDSPAVQRATIGGRAALTLKSDQGFTRFAVSEERRGKFGAWAPSSGTHMVASGTTRVAVVVFDRNSNASKPTILALK